ncbi:ABC transporter permease [Sporolactobacillus kofuensis]|uniref:ABC transporter permease n=1 Tax=Sporolactobacillus kofuensis TaxID=269672 RepID=A0ABW1WDY9_9BACL|nr:ABC transporter permease [Sporolactobacillus kofuensis]MCO7174880.1 ABC transporter permease [Sporolactobacillus kofuensis]
MNTELSWGSKVMRIFGKDKTAALGITIIIVTALVAIFADWLSPYGPNSAADTAQRLAMPGTAGHLFGTDDQGRDILSRIIYGTRTSLFSSIVPVVISAVVSMCLGIIAGFFQGRIGNSLMRIMDVFFAFPSVLLAIAIAAILGPGLLNVCIAMVIVRIPYMTRIVYTDTIQEMQKEYVEASRAYGMGRAAVMFREIMPNVLPSLIVYSATLCGVTIVTVAGLSFIGLGVQPPTADWGLMASEGQNVLMQGDPYVTLFPGLAIIILAFAFSTLGDWLRDLLDPTQK